MTRDTTTIEIRDDQLDTLKERKQYPRETYKTVLDRLLSNETPTPDADVSAKYPDIDDVKTAARDGAREAIEEARQ